jgi:CcmD family protein
MRTGRKVDFLGEARNNPNMSSAPDPAVFFRSLAFLAGVNVVIWVGLFFYLWRLDRRITAREREQ